MPSFPLHLALSSVPADVLYRGGSLRRSGGGRPFPQHTVYAGGSIKPASVSPARLDRETAGFYDSWKRKRLIASKTHGQFYVAFDDHDAKAGEDVIAVSEGMGYGMIITGFMAGHDPDARKWFDGLFRFYTNAIQARTIPA